MIENAQILLCYIMFLLSTLTAAFVIEHVFDMEEISRLFKM